MEFWRLAPPDTFSEPALLSHHNHWLCAIAVVLAIFAAWVFIPVVQRFHSSRSSQRFLWLLVGSIVMGTGIWAMHFTGMLAFSLPLKVEYDLFVTLFSGLPAVLASAGFMLLYKSDGMTTLRIQLIALIMAVGIGAMHYIGMEAIIVDADMFYNPVFFLFSIFAAYVLAYIGVYAQTRLIESDLASQLQSKLIASITLGTAVSAMHFIAMSATYFQPLDNTVLGSFSGPPVELVSVVIIITLVLLGFTLVSIIVDQRMQEMSRLLQYSEVRFQRLAESTQTAIFTFNNNHVTYANPELSQITGRDNTELYELPLEKIFNKDFYQVAQNILDGTIQSDQVFHREFKIRSADAEEKWLYCSMTLEEFENNAAGLASAFDITEQKHAEMSMRKLAYYDQLTQLHNRTVFMERLEHHLELLQRSNKKSQSCVMILDLDNFKSVNDTLGHLQGDKLLIAVAERLRKIARKSDTISRFGGDEFVLLLEEMDSRFNADIVAQRILSLLKQPILLDGRKIDIPSSIGIVELDKSYNSHDQVLHDADIALYRAKELGRGSWVIFDQALDAKAKRQRLLKPELKNAIKENQLQMYYQPICSSKDQSVRGFEALARWQRKNGEWVGPDEFIPLAEESGLIFDIGLWALESAAIELARLNASKHETNLYISINIDADSLMDERFYNGVVSSIQTFKLKRGQLKIELTERGLIKDTESILPKMHGLIALGCEFMIDDFGTGYSSLSYLHRLPIHSLKIDRSFIINLEESESSEPVVKTIIALAESLNLNVVAEGVETEQQVQHLFELGSHQLQGYHFSRPMPADDMLDYLQRHQNSTKESVINLWTDETAATR